MIEIGDEFIISDFCLDEDLMNWYEQEGAPILTVSVIDYNSGLVWSDECEYGILFEDIIQV